MPPSTSVSRPPNISRQRLVMMELLTTDTQSATSSQMTKTQQNSPLHLHHTDSRYSRCCMYYFTFRCHSTAGQAVHGTDFSKRAFRSSASTVWNSLPQTLFISDSLSVFKYKLKTFLLHQGFTEHRSDLTPTPLKLRPYGTIEIQLLLLQPQLFTDWLTM